MADEQLRDYVLQRAEDDDTLSEPARLMVLCAWRNLPAGAPLTVAMSGLDAEVEALAWRQAASLTTPEVSDVERACAAMRSAAAAQADAERAVDALAVDRVQFLETSLEFHDRHGTQPCPVCGEGTLDDQWVARARGALAAERDAATALRVARSAAHRTRQTLTALVRAVDAPPAEDVLLTTIVAARVAYERFSALPVDDDEALAEHVASALPELRAAYEVLRTEAASKLESVREAQRWLRALASDLPR